MSKNNNRTVHNLYNSLSNQLTLSPHPIHSPTLTSLLSLLYCPTINVADAVRIPPPEAVGVALHPVVTVMVSVGMTQPVVQVGQTFLVTVEVAVVGQQSVLRGGQST